MGKAKLVMDPKRLEVLCRDNEGYPDISNLKNVKDLVAKLKEVKVIGRAREGQYWTDWLGRLLGLPGGLTVVNISISICLFIEVEGEYLPEYIPNRELPHLTLIYDAGHWSEEDQVYKGGLELQRIEITPWQPRTIWSKLSGYLKAEEDGTLTHIVTPEQGDDQDDQEKPE